MTVVRLACGHDEDSVTWVRGLTIGRLSQSIMGQRHYREPVREDRDVSIHNEILTVVLASPVPLS